MNRFLKLCKNPMYLFLKIDDKTLHLLSDEAYLKIKYRYLFGENIDLALPKTFNQKLQWLKLHDRKDIYTVMVDKYEAKKYVSEVIGERYVIPTLGVYNRFDEISFDELPEQLVIKCTHDSGGLVIVRNKSKVDINEIRKKINKSLRRNYYFVSREWPYKNVKPRIIVEKYMRDSCHDELRDYKFFCFNGEPEVVLVCSDRFCGTGLKETWYDNKWNRLPFTEGGHEVDDSLTKPDNFDLMLKLARVLSKNIPFVRVDFYSIDGDVFFGEITFYPASGYERFNPVEWDKKLGDMINLDLAKK